MNITMKAQSEERAKFNLTSVAVFVGLSLLSVPFILPLFWMVTTGLKTPEQVYAFPPVWIPQPAVFENFATGWNSASFTLYLRNSIITTVLPLIGDVFVSAMVAYSFSRVRWPGRDKVFGLCLATMLLPGIVTLIPLFVQFRALGWVNTFLPLIVPAFFGNAFYIFILRQFMMNLPPDLEEAARVDGANTFQIFIRIILPLTKPALATVAIFSFLAHWNDFLTPMIYLQSPDLKTLSLGLSTFESAFTGTGGTYSLVSPRLNLLMAVAFLINVPCIVLFVMFQRYFVRDVISSGLKL